MDRLIPRWFTCPHTVARLIYLIAT